MQKRRLLALVFGLLLAFSGYAQSDSETQSESKGSFFISGGIYNGFFSDSPIYLLPHFELKKLFAAMVSGNYEVPVGSGLTSFGLEAGYSSGSRFGGRGAVDFIPFNFSAAYVFPLVKNLYIGPRLKIGGLGLLANDWNDVILTAGARLEAELRSINFPFGLFVSGGIDLFPTAPEFATLPVIEAGLRFPRGKLKKSGSPDTAKKDTGGSKANSSGQNAAANATPGAATGAGTGTAGAGTGATQGTTGGTQNQSTAGAPTIGAPTTGAPTVGAPTTPSSPVTSQGAGAGTAQGQQSTGTGTTGTTQNQSTAGTSTTPNSPATSQGAGVTQSQTPAASATGGSVTVGSGTVGSGLTGIAQNISIILEDGKQGTLNSIYFEPDTAVLIESYRSILEAVGRQLAADPGLKLLIRAYAADFGTADGRYLVSANRARFSRDFFTSQYGISANRLSFEAFGADKSPVYATADWQSHRCVELILFRD